MTDAAFAAQTLIETDGVPLMLRPVLRRLAHLPVGALTVDLPGGGYVRVRGHQPGPEASLRLIRLRAARRFLLGGALGFGEAFVDGDWDTPDLTQLLSYFLANQREVSFEPPTGFGWLPRLAHALNRNSKGGSRRNIASHYDLGNAFYALWLDRSMTYSAAVFDGTDDLEAAQRAKYQRMADLAGIKPGDRVLEIGCGWGGFAEYAAAERGAEVVGITLSAEQLKYAEARLAAAGLSHRARFALQDYRDTEGTFDRIVSIEMLEAVGEAYWPTYFQTIRRLLVPGGGAALQGIVIEDHRYREYRATPDFIQTHIFPGGMLPSPSILADQFKHAGLAPLQEFGIGEDYARTLGRWRDQFLAAWDDISRLGFDERFRRLWTYYLGYCEVGFRFGAIDVRQIGLRAV